MGNFPLLWNDWQWFLHFEWTQQTRTMRDYIKTTEAAFAKEDDSFGDWIEEHEGAISEDNAEAFGDECAARIISLQDDFPSLARQMAFCATFAYLEHQLFHVCDAVMVFRKLPSTVRQEDDRGLDAVKSFMKRVAKIDLRWTPTVGQFWALDKV